MNKQEQEVLVQNQLNIMNQCYYCVQMNELCPDCLDSKEARDTVIANQMVDESSDYLIMGYGSNEYQVANGGTITESSPMSDIHDQPSGHDWISNEVITRISVDKSTGLTTKTIRTELFEASSWLVDRLFNIEDSITLSIHECVCSVCHYTINKHAVCPNCN
jgi:hypothetical protein